MKKLMAVITVCGLSTLLSSGTTLWLTNNSDQVLSYAFSDSETPTPLGTISLGTTVSVTYEPLAYLWLYSAENDENFYSNAPSDGDYGLNIESYPLSGGPAWNAIPVPEPTAGAIFMMGFAFSMTTGLTAWGASAVRRTIAGGKNE